MLVIPAIDLKDGAVVRLHQGHAGQETRYASDPVVVAREWQEQGARWLHVVDLDGAFSGCPKHLGLVEQMVKAIGVPIQFGGGLRSLLHVEQAFDTGVERVILGSLALTDPDLLTSVVERYGERIAVAVDVREEKVYTSGWQEESHASPMEVARRLQSANVARIIYTDISRDGTMEGPNLEATKRMAQQTGLAVIASGGVSTLADIRRLTQLQEVGVEGAIVGKALYEKRFTLGEAIEAARG